MAGLASSANALPPMGSTKTGLVATAGGGQANALLLPADYNVVGTVATAGDSVKLPPATPGTSVAVMATVATSMNIFPQSGEAIGAGAADAASALAAANIVHLFTCVVAGRWAKFVSIA